MKRIFVSLLALLLLCGCSDKGDETEPEGYSVVLNNVEIAVGDEFKESMFPEAISAFEDYDCAFGDYDTYYEYSDYEILVVGIEDKLYIRQITLLNENAPTKEGLKVGVSTYDDMIKAMGQPTKDADVRFFYQKGTSIMNILIIDNVIMSIDYTAEEAE